MADIKVTSTNKVFYQLDSGVAALLLEAFPASFERVEKPKPALSGPRFVLTQNPMTLRWQIAAHFPDGETMVHSGTPEAAKQWEWRGSRIPAELIAQYAEHYEAPTTAPFPVEYYKQMQPEPAK